MNLVSYLKSEPSPASVLRPEYETSIEKGRTQFTVVTFPSLHHSAPLNEGRLIRISHRYDGYLFRKAALGLYLVQVDLNRTVHKSIWVLDSAKPKDLSFDDEIELLLPNRCYDYVIHLNYPADDKFFGSLSSTVVMETIPKEVK